MNRISNIRKIFVPLLFAVYTFSVVPFTAFHFHDSACKGGDKTAVENDPCHLAIYHHNEYPGIQCHHNHLSTPQKKCEWCKHINHLSQHFTESKPAIQKSSSDSYLGSFYQISPSFSFHSLSNKSPPSFLAWSFIRLHRRQNNPKPSSSFFIQC